MKNFQQKLLIILALALCALCAWQWRVQTLQRGWLKDRDEMLYHKNIAIGGYTNELTKTSQQITRLEQSLAGLNDSFTTTLKTNGDLIIQQKRDIARLSADNDTLKSDIAQYTNFIAVLQTNLDTAYAGIKKQNEAIDKLEPYYEKYTNTVARYNDLASNYNDVIGKYTNLVDRFNKLQAAPATNAPRR
jgi:chromosome segregation ATPase